MLRLLPLVFAFLLLSFMVYLPMKEGKLFNNPNKISLGLTPAHPQVGGTAPDGQNGDYNLADVLNTTGDFDPVAAYAIFNNKPADYPGQQLADAFNTRAQQETAVLGTTNAAGEEKWIEVNLATQTLTAWEGNRVVKQFLVSTGLWNSTHTGTFYIWYKTRSQRMKGGSKELGTYYDLPNVPNNMFYEGDRALHGAYWHHNFGHVMSHGCVNEPLDEAAWMFDWAGPVVPPGVNALRASAENPGTRVWVH